jgi:hypothetical protein
MQDKHLFEYAVIRIVPRVEREEFLNAGVILYCQKLKFLQLKFHIDINRLNCFFGTADTTELIENLAAMERICSGATGSGPIGQLDLASRFRWLTATRSTVLQFSKVHPGLTDDPMQTLERLFGELVL